MSYWKAGIGAVASVVVVVAALLLAIIATARSILAKAEQILEVAPKIIDNTRSIWGLEQTTTVAAELHEEAQSIERLAEELAAALEAPQPAGSR